jgi:hypothetical protein
MSSLSRERRLFDLARNAAEKPAGEGERMLARGILFLKTDLDATRAELVKALLEIAALCQARNEWVRATALRAQATELACLVGPRPPHV